MKRPISLHISPPAPPAGHHSNKPGWHYTQPETGMPFNTLGIGALEKKVYVHRAATNLYIGLGWQMGLHDQLCEQMPWIACEEIPTPENHPLVIAGRKHWKELHDYAATWSGNREDAEDFLRDWRRRIPHFGCSCSKHFQQIEAARPVDLASPEWFVQWTVNVHNDVNARLGKPLWPFTT